MTEGSIFPMSLSPIFLLLKCSSVIISHILPASSQIGRSLVFYPVIEDFCDVVCDIITLDLRVEPTFVPQQRMKLLQLHDHIINTNKIDLMLLIHLTSVCACYMVQVFLTRKLLDVVLHKVSETLPPLNMREDFMHYCCQAFASIRMNRKNRKLSYSLT
jgi:hypothetical protein